VTAVNALSLVVDYLSPSVIESQTHVFTPALLYHKKLDDELESKIHVPLVFL